MDFLLQQNVWNTVFETDGITDPAMDLVTLIENHFGEYTDRVLAQWADTFYSLIDQFGAQGAFEFILAYQDPTNL